MSLARLFISSQRSQLVKYKNLVHTCFIRHESVVASSDKDGVRELALNDPKRRNALSLDMMDHLIAGFSDLEMKNDVRCVVISSTGPVYSSGHNFKELEPEQGYENHKKVFAKCGELMRSIRGAPVPVIAKVDGLAAAGGCQLVASCDIVVSSDRSSFSTPGANFGLFCSTPGIALARAMPRNKSLYMLFTGLPISAQDAYIAGLVSIVVPHVKLEEEMQKVCDSIKNKSRDVLKIGKEFYQKQILMDVEEAYKCGAIAMADNLQLPDGQEGIRSFFEKRPPKWKL